LHFYLADIELNNLLCYGITFISQCKVPEVEVVILNVIQAAFLIPGPSDVKKQIDCQGTFKFPNIIGLVIIVR